MNYPFLFGISYSLIDDAHLTFVETILLHLVWNIFKGEILHRLHPHFSLDWIIALELPITYDNHPIPIPSNRHIALKTNSHEPGIDAPPGEAGGSCPPHPLGRAGLRVPPRPTPPRENDENRGEVAGQNKGRTLNFLHYRKPMMEQYYNTEQCPIKPGNV